MVSPPSAAPGSPLRTASPMSASPSGSPVIRVRSSASSMTQARGSASLSPARAQSRSPPPTSASSPAPFFGVTADMPPPSSPSLSLNALTHSHAPHPHPHPPNAGGLASPAPLSRPSSPPKWLSSGPPSPTKSLTSEGGLFERDIEFAPAHVLSAAVTVGVTSDAAGAHEAVDVAIPPVLSEAAVALASTDDAATMRRSASSTSLLRRKLLDSGIGAASPGEDVHGASTLAEASIFPPSPPSPSHQPGWQSPAYALELAESTSQDQLQVHGANSPRPPRRSLSPGTLPPSSIGFPAGELPSPSPLVTPPADESALRRVSFMSYSDLINMERGTTPLDVASLGDALPPSSSPPLLRRGREPSPLHA